MKKKILWITQTAVMLALLVTLQTLTKGLGQYVTGSFVNGVLAVTVLVGGLSSGIVVALFSPVVAFLLNIAPQVLTVPAIMVGNTLFVVILYFVAGKAQKNILRQLLAWISAALAKSAVLYAIVVGLICNVLAPYLMGSGMLNQKMIGVLTMNFSVPQLVTALIGGGVALLIAPVICKALHK